MKMQILFFKAFEIHSTLKIEVNTQTRRGFLELQELLKKSFRQPIKWIKSPNII